MDINILLGLQDFRNGAGAFLADFLLKMTYFGELNTVLGAMVALVAFSRIYLGVHTPQDILVGAV